MFLAGEWWNRHLVRGGAGARTRAAVCISGYWTFATAVAVGESDSPWRRPDRYFFATAFGSGGTTKAWSATLACTHSTKAANGQSSTARVRSLDRGIGG